MPGSGAALRWILGPARRWLSLASLVLVLIAAACDSATDIESLREGVARIVVKEGEKFVPAGAGFLISNDGHVVTSLPRLEGKEVFVIPPFEDGSKPLPAKIVWRSAPYELAVLLVPKFDGRPVAIADVKVVPNTELYVSGYPEDGCCSTRVGPEFLTGSVGRVVELTRTAGGAAVPVIMHSVKIHAGNDGGPLLDSCGGAIGVANAALDPSGSEAQAIFFGAPLRPVMQALTEAGIPYTIVDKPCKD